MKKHLAYFILGLIIFSGCSSKEVAPPPEKPATKTESPIQNPSPKKPPVIYSEEIHAAESSQISSLVPENIPALKTPTLLKLDDGYKTPYGITFNTEDHCVYLVSPAIMEEGDARLARIREDNSYETIFRIPAHPITKHAGALEIAFAPDGNLYFTDAQDICGHPNHDSRLMRILFEHGKPSRCEVLATNFVSPRGLAIWGNKVYFTEARVTENQPEKIISGVFCFDLNEFNSEKPYVAKAYDLSTGEKDPHFIFQTETDNPAWRMGVHGLAFSSDGKMYVSNFGNKQLWEITLAPDGKAVSSQRLVAQAQGMESLDGITVNTSRGLVYGADYAGNAVHAIHITSGKVFTLAKNPLGTGESGALDRCCNICIRGNNLFVVNLDLEEGVAGNHNDEPHGLSIIQVEDNGL